MVQEKKRTKTNLLCAIIYSDKKRTINHERDVGVEVLNNIIILIAEYKVTRVGWHFR